MKKIFTLLAAAICSMSMLVASAATVTVTPAGGNYNVTIDQLTITDVPAITQGDVNVLAINRDGVSLLVRFTDVNTLVADGTVNGSAVHYATAAATSRALEYQIPNSDFEVWNETIMEPVSSWHSFKTCFGDLAAMARDQSKLYRSNYTATEKSQNPALGNHYATIEAKSVFFGLTIANGTLTTGRLQAQASSAEDTRNHSEMDITKTYTDDYAKYGPYYVLLKAEPDYIKSMMKVELNNSNHRATVSAAITDGTYYQEPQDKNYTNVAATAGSKTIANCGWTEMSFPFTYTDGVDAKAIMVTFSTNATPGQGNGGDKVSVDNVELGYNAGITAITATGLEGFAFDADTRHYELTGNYSDITADNFTVTTDGRAAIVVKNVEDLGHGNYRITLGAYSADMMNASVYTITITKPIDNVWVLGNVNGNDWAPNVGALMNYNEADGIYTLDITATETAYFSFTKRLAENNDQGGWDYIAPYRFGAVSNGDFWVTDDQLDKELSLQAGQTAFKIPAGEYELTVNCEAMTLVIHKLGGSEYTTGDVTGDGKVDVADVNAAINIILKSKTQEDYTGNADMNGDGKVDVSDVNNIINIILKV